MRRRWGSKRLEKTYGDILKKIDLFQGIEKSTLDAIGASLSIIEVKEGHILFHQDDPSDAMYIILSGYLMALLRNKNGKYRPIGRIKTGELVGETGLLTQQARGLTIKALSDVELLKFSTEDFENLKKQAPEVVYQILRNTLIRSQKNINIISEMADKMMSKRSRHVVIMPANESVNMAEFTTQLNTLLQENKHAAYVFSMDKLLSLYNIEGATGVLTYLDELEKIHHTILYFVDERIEKLLHFFSRKIDAFAFVGDIRQTPYLSQMNQKILAHKEMQPVKKELILLSHYRTDIHRTKAWLSLAPFHFHYHAISAEKESYQRLLRFLQGNPIGLVLSGGLTRGWAHLGVIKAMQALKIPIDMIGGTSVGAGVAGFYLISQNEWGLQACMQKAVDGFQKSLSWKSLTVPIISFYDSNAITEALQEMFRDTLLEDLAIPCFAISTNISTNTEIIHREGKMWEAIRASGALPAVFPPIVKEGQLLFDGGLVNNFPVDSMRKLLGKNAIIIGSDLQMTAPDDIKYDFPPILPFGQNLRSRFGRNKQKYVFPPFLSTIIKAMLTGASQRAKANIQLSDYYIHIDPEAQNEAFAFDKTLIPTFIQKGYDAAMEVLNNFEKIS